VKWVFLMCLVLVYSINNFMCVFYAFECHLVVMGVDVKERCNFNMEDGYDYEVESISKLAGI
jgi:hypothetical protein